MKALVLEDNKQLRVQDRPIPEAVAERSLLVKVAACGVCGSDIPRGFFGKAYHYPLVMGHEFSAIVAEDQPWSRFREGDRVAVFPLVPTDPSDKAYQTGDYALMKTYNYFGSRCDGAFEEYLRVPEANLFPLPEHVDILHASMTEPAAVALHGVGKLHIQPGDTGVVLGAGPIGNMTAQWLRIRGCREVVVVDIDRRKLQIASEMGFSTIDASQTDPVQTLLDQTGGMGAHRVVEAVGLPLTFLQAIQMAGQFGEVVFMGNLEGTFEMKDKEFTQILRKELSIYGTWNSKIVPRGEDDWSTVLKYMDRELQVAPLISDVVSLDQGPEVFDSIVHKKKFHNKVIFKIND